SSSMRCVWNGPTLKSRDEVEWKVRLWDEKDEAGAWTSARFEMGLLEKNDWQAKWITGDYVPKTKRKLLRAYTGGKAQRYPVDCFKKEFDSNTLSKARLYITACGLYEAHLNGKRVGDFIMAPGYTDYTKRVQYQTYDVTELLKDGNNEITVMLADGWYRGATGAWGLLCEYGYETKVLVQLELTDHKGNKTTIMSDDSWLWSNDGPIRFADNKDGEIVDSRLMPSYSGKAKVTSHSVIPVASNNVKVCEHETFKPTVITTPSGKKVLDFGQNIAGYLSFELNAKEGQRVFLRFGEMFDKEGEFTQTNIQVSVKGHTSPLQQIEYICHDGLNNYKPTFTVFGFQYVLIETDVAWKPEDFTAIAVYSDLEVTGSFDSSNTLLNKFVENTIWSGKNNFLDVPTDCPTRERHAWTGDIQIFTRSAEYLFDFNPFGRKYLKDVYDAQYKNGCLPQIAPIGGIDFFMKCMDGSVGWADVGVLMPYRLYEQYHDRQVLEEHYEGMKRYARFMQKRCGKKTLVSKPLKLKGEARKYAVNYGQCYGEWA
ncbi:MAG: family 78 glycoside hydrolase catalytic domain, partial [Erysipelotrichaceae bacterium]|nr:family 78 glycoside hydrolase catalytic domain [Erysipelotrichaceae bacterium]